jgi:hypothetical protein
MRIFGFWTAIWAFVQSIGEARRAYELYSALSSMSDAELGRMGYTREQIVHVVMDQVNIRGV